MNIIKPIITEKSLTSANAGWFTFSVLPGADKRSIAREIHELYAVDVESVRTVIGHGKVRRTGKTMKTKQLPGGKKAYVLLKKGQTIEVFQIGSGEETKK